MIEFMIGLFVGSLLGVGAMCLLQIIEKDD